MTNYTAIHSLENLNKTTKNQNCYFQKLKSIENNNLREGSFIWTKKDQSWVLSAYFYGHIITQVSS